MDKAVTNSMYRNIIKRIERKEFHRSNSEHVANVLVQFIRAASKTKYGRGQDGPYIGSNCMSVVLTPNPEDDFIAKYHPVNDSPQQYIPHLVTQSISLWGLQVWTGAEKPPWLK